MHELTGSGTAGLHFYDCRFSPPVRPIKIVYRSDSEIRNAAPASPPRLWRGVSPSHESASQEFDAFRRCTWWRRDATTMPALRHPSYCFCPDVNTVQGPAFMSRSNGFCHEYS